MTISISEKEMWEHAIATVVRKTLLRVSRTGICDGRQFYVQFVTKYPDVSLSEDLVERHPNDILISLSDNSFGDLVVDEAQFHVSLSFDGEATTVRVPYAAITAFSESTTKSYVRRRRPALIRDAALSVASGERQSNGSPCSTDLPDFDCVFIEGIRDTAATAILLLDSVGVALASRFSIRFSASHPGVIATETFKAIHDDQVEANFAMPAIQLIRAGATHFEIMHFTERVSVPYAAVTLVEMPQGSMALGIEVVDREIERATEGSHVPPQSQSPFQRLRDALLTTGNTDEAHGRSSTTDDVPADGMGAQAPADSGVAANAAGGLSILSTRACAYAAIAYVLLAAITYLALFGFDPAFVVCVAVLEVNPACAGQTSDLIILEKLTHPFSIHIFPLLVFYAATLSVAALMARAISGRPDIKTLFKAGTVLNGFVLGFFLAKAIVGIWHGASVADKGLVMNLVSFAYIYLLYAATFFLRHVLPNARQNEVEYANLFDAIFALGAAGLFALGFDKNVDEVTSGAVFIVCAFLAMLAFKRTIIRTNRKAMAAMALTASTVAERDDPSVRELFRDFFVARRQVSMLSNEQLQAGLQAAFDSGLKQSADLKFETFLDRRFDNLMLALLILWFVPAYCVLWLVLRGLLHLAS
jgi:predicted membrane channel-forming protein YqfA (hemolysin III family)